MCVLFDGGHLRSAANRQAKSEANRSRFKSWRNALRAGMPRQALLHRV